jgi:hypothetical protein
VSAREWVTTEYVCAHGRAPRGLGTWAFIPDDGIWPGEIPQDGIAWAWGTYSEAKREVAARHPEVTCWRVLS